MEATPIMVHFHHPPLYHPVGTKLGGRPRPLCGLAPSLVPEPITKIPVTYTVT